MTEKIQYNDLLYLWKEKNDKYLFEGIPCPTINAWNILGDEGVKIIHQQLAELLFWTKRRRGDRVIENYGFAKTEQFLDLRTNVVFRVGRTINDNIGITPELMISEKLKSNNYEILKAQDHYLIQIVGTLRKSNLPKNIPKESLRIEPL